MVVEGFIVVGEHLLKAVLHVGGIRLGQSPIDKVVDYFVDDGVQPKADGRPQKVHQRKAGHVLETINDYLKVKKLMFEKFLMSFKLTLEYLKAMNS